MFTAQHFNAIAKDIRELFQESIDSRTRDDFDPREIMLLTVAQATLGQVALKLAIRFKKEREGYDGYAFDPIKFLNACSPDPEKYPLAHLWKSHEVIKDAV